MPFLRRRHFLIDKHYQIKHLLITLILIALFVLILMASIFLPHVFELFSDVPLAEKAKAAEIALILHKNVWSSIGIASIVIAIASIFITHKVAGPVYTLKRVMREVTDGNMRARAKLRKGDDIRDMEAAVNEMAGSLEAALIAMDIEVKQISSNIIEMEKKLVLPNTTNSTLLELSGKIKGEIKVIEKRLDTFQYGEKQVS